VQEVCAGVGQVEDGDARSEGMVLDCNSTVKVILSVFFFPREERRKKEEQTEQQRRGPEEIQNISILIHLNIRLLVAAC
jgi:hypothetical protein